MHFNTIICVLFFLFLMKSSYVTSMTRQQFKDSGKLLKKNCMPKNDVTEAGTYKKYENFDFIDLLKLLFETLYQVGDIDQGKFIEQRNVMCYIACIYTMGQAVKNNKINHDAMIKQADMMFPADIKEKAKAAVNQCRDVAKKYKDICEVSFWTAKCMYEADTNSFLFP